MTPGRTPRPKRAKFTIHFVKPALILIATVLFLSPAAFAAPKAASSEIGTSPAQQELAKQYSRGNYALSFAGEAFGFVLLGFVAASGLGVKFREWAQKATRRPNRIVFLTSAILTTFLSLASLPLHVYRSHFREQRYGF